MYIFDSYILEKFNTILTYLVFFQSVQTLFRKCYLFNFVLFYQKIVLPSRGYQCIIAIQTQFAQIFVYFIIIYLSLYYIVHLSNVVAYSKYVEFLASPYLSVMPKQELGCPYNIIEKHHLNENNLTYFQTVSPLIQCFP